MFPVSQCESESLYVWCETNCVAVIALVSMSPLGETSYSGRGSANEFCRTCTDFKTWTKMHTDKKPDVKVTVFLLGYVYSMFTRILFITSDLMGR